MTKTFIGCYEKSFTYVDGQTNTQLPISQIQSLIELSEYCEQTFYYECTLAPLTVSHTDEDIDYAFWEDRHGNINNYFTGKMVQVEWLTNLRNSINHNDFKAAHMDSMHVTVTMIQRDVLNLKSLRDVTVMQIFQYP